MLENVSNLVQKPHKKDFDLWLEKLNNIGYKTIWSIIDSSKYGLLQKRRRVFALSIYDPDNKLNWETSIKKTLDEELLEIFKSKEFQPLWIQNINEVFDFENFYKDESILSQIKKTPSRKRMIKDGFDISNSYKGRFSTITTKQDRWPNAGSIEFKNKRSDKNGIKYTNRRFLTPRECYYLMGFEKQQFDKAKIEMNKKCVSEINAREKLYKQAGNSIAVNVLEMIFYYIQKIQKGE